MLRKRVDAMFAHPLPIFARLLKSLPKPSPIVRRTGGPRLVLAVGGASRFSAPLLRIAKCGWLRIGMICSFLQRVFSTRDKLVSRAAASFHSQ